MTHKSIKISRFLWMVKLTITRGIIFCHVIRIVELRGPILLITLTNHWWNGTDAIFTIIERVNTVLNRSLDLFISIIMDDSRMTAEAAVWIIKYFRVPFIFNLSE